MLHLCETAILASRSMSTVKNAMSANTDGDELVNLATSPRTPGCCEDPGGWHGDRSHSGSGVQCCSVREEADVTATFN